MMNLMKYKYEGYASINLSYQHMHMLLKHVRLIS